ncbi:MAG TPA: ATP-binding protein, partial [Thermoplasmata archaeon]|nr:ATP-binding protein [Thermoplasmata archaeon]
MKERILIHLIEYAKYVDELEVPSAITQEGIARETGIDVPHFTQYVRPLIQEGLIRERMAHVKGVRRRRKVYDLTDTGKLSAVRLRDKLKSEVLRVRDQKEVREASVSQILKEVSRKVSLLDVLRQAMETGIVDLASLAGVPLPSFVEMLSDAPQLKTFVGRRAELEAITGESEQPRVFVVRGVAGIGKSSFGAKATELLRGKRNLFWHQVRRWDTHLSILASLGDFLAALGRPGLRSVLTRDTMDRAVQVLREDMPGTQSFLVMDDAHEASPDAVASLRLLKEIIADAPDVRLLVLTRETLPFYDRRDVVVRGLVREMELGGLVPEEVEALLSPKLYRATSDVVRQLGGHPLFLELVRASPDALPTH